MRPHPTHARKAGLSWAEIATALGVTRQAAWERWHEIDETMPKSDAWGPFSLNDTVPERFRGPVQSTVAGTSDPTFSQR